MNVGRSQNTTPANRDLRDLSSTNLETNPDVTLEDVIRAAETRDNGHTMLEKPGSLTAKHTGAPSLGHDPTEKYTLRREIARGGMGIVMEAEDLKLTRSVAMKVMLDPSTASRQRVLRFIEEARITSKLQHPGIMPIYELGVDKNGNVFYTMKHVTGKTLKDILKELKDGNKQTEAEYPLNRLLTILLRVCDAVAYAHDKGVIHRDLKPENIMTGDYGEVLVLDWGLAKVLKRRTGRSFEDSTYKTEIHTSATLDGVLESPGAETENDSPIVTMEGNAIGTPGYMAPEQARGQVARMDEKSDIYSLGAILYHILTLESTVQHDKPTNRQELLEKISAGKIEHPKETRRAPKALIAIAMKALSLRPKDRYPTAKKFQADLDAYLGGFATSTDENSIPKLITLLVLRHKVVSFFSLLILTLLTAALSANYSERVKAEAERVKASNADQVAAAEGRRASEALSNLRATAPALISLADYHVEKQEMQKALEVIDRATTLVTESADCHRKKGDILQSLKKFKGAAAEYEKVLSLDPSDKSASANLNLSRQMTQKIDIQLLSSALWEQQRFSEACFVMLPSMKKQKPEMVKLLLQWILGREKIQYRDIQVDDNTCRLDLSKSNIADLSPLKVIPLTHLILTDCTSVYDLRPLKGIPLKGLVIERCTSISDLSAIEGMPIESLNINGSVKITDLTLLKGMPLKELDVTGSQNIPNLQPLGRLQLTKLKLGGCTNIIDLTPLKGMSLTDLDLSGCNGLTNLTPLKGMPLAKLDVSGCTGITDLHPLKGMHLAEIKFTGCPGIQDLSPLKGMAISRFNGGTATASAPSAICPDTTL